MAPAVRANALALDPELARRACVRHLEVAHLRLGGRIDTVGPLRCHTHALFHWTFFNAARLARAVSLDEAPALVAAVRDYYTRHGLRPILDLSAQLAPPTLAPYLAEAGFAPDRWDALMVCQPPPSPMGTGAGGEVPLPPPSPLRRGAGGEVSFPPPSPMGTGAGGEVPLSIDPVHAETLDDFVTVWRQGFAPGANTSVSQVRSLFERDLATGWEFRVARRSGEPVGAIAYLSVDGVSQIANVATVGRARRQGIASALVHVCLDEAARRGDHLVYLQAAAGSVAEGMYHKLGFVTIDTWTTYIED